MERMRDCIKIIPSIALAILLVVFSASAQEKKEPTDEEIAEFFWQQGYIYHMIGQYQAAVMLFRESIKARPTAKGHTYLGWSLSHMGRYEEAIRECQKAINLDPDHGNPYNDIGVYLMELGRPEEAIEYLNKALNTKNYCCYQFPHFNLGRIYLDKKDYARAKKEFEEALRIDPDYLLAKVALEQLKQMLTEI